jgi:hypothetical protein
MRRLLACAGAAGLGTSSAPNASAGSGLILADPTPKGGIFTAGKVTVVGATTNRFVKVAHNLHNYPTYP